jgi:hypothetical protein
LVAEEEARGRADEARAWSAFSEQSRARERIGAAGRVRDDCEALETESVGELGDVERPMLEATPGLQVGAAESRPIDGDEVHTGCLRRLLVGAPEPGERRPVEEEDRPTL